jgi:hypothetical protein
MPILAWALVARQLVPEVRAAEDVLRRALPPAAPTMGPFR